MKRSFNYRSTIPDVVLAQHKPFYSRRASEDEVLSVESTIFLVRKQPALQALVSLVYHVTNLQCALHAPALDFT